MPSRRAHIPAKVAGVAVALAAIAVLVTRALYLTTSTNGPLSAVAIGQVYALLFEGHCRLDTLATWTPMYARFASLVTMTIDLFGGPSPHEGCRWTGILLTAASVVPLYWLARTLLNSRLGGLAAVAIYVVIPLTWWFSGEMLPDAAGTAWLLWPFGLLARWWSTRQPRYVGLACLMMGTTPLVHFGTGVLYLPLFILVVALGAPGRSPWHSLRLLPLIAVVPAVCYGAVAWATDVPGPAALINGVTAFDLFGSRLNAPNDEMLRFMLEMALGPVAYYVAGIGVLALAFVRPTRLPFVLAWAAIVVVPQWLAEQTAIRFYLPLMPAVAIAIAAIPVLLARRPITRPVGLAGIAAVLVFTVGYARRDLETLSSRYNVMDAINAWYIDHTPYRSMVIAGIEIDHVKVLGGGRQATAAPSFEDQKSHPDWMSRVRTPIALVEHLDAWLLSGGHVYTHDWIALEAFHALGSHYRLTKVGDLTLTNLRNFRDPEFGWMGEGLKITKPLSFFRLTMRDRLPRAAPAPVVHWHVADGNLRLVATTTVPQEPGATCRLWVSRSEDALDWTRPTFAQDALLQETSAADNADTEFVLNRGGAGGINIALEVDAPLTKPVWVAYAVLDRAGNLRRISVARKSPNPPPVPRGAP